MARPVFTISPYNGNRRTAILWRVVQLDGGDFVPVTKPLLKNEAEARELEFRATARKKTKELSK